MKLRQKSYCRENLNQSACLEFWNADIFHEQIIWNDALANACECSHSLEMANKNSHEAFNVQLKLLPNSP